MEDKYPVKNPDIVVREEETESLLFDPASGDMMCVNFTGMAIWRLCDGGHSEKNIADVLTQKFEVTADAAEKDCKAYLKEMSEAGFIGYREGS